MIIKSYSHKEEGKTISIGDEKIKFGIEIEIVKGSNDKVSPFHCLRAMEKTNTREHGKVINTVEYDSSVDVEFKTEMFTKAAFDVFVKKKIKNFFDYLVTKGYKSFQGGRCGMHIHVSPCNYSYAIPYIKSCKNELFQISLRETMDNRYCNWENLGYDEGTYKYQPFRIVNGKHCEFRLFRGALDIELLETYLEVVEQTVIISNKKEPVSTEILKNYRSFLQAKVNQINYITKTRKII